MASEAEVGGRRVLIVEDEAGIAEVLADLLGDEGYETAVSVDGAALAAVVDAPPALILLDVMMPDLDGRDACRALKMDLELQDIPVVLLSLSPTGASNCARFLFVAHPRSTSRAPSRNGE